MTWYVTHGQAVTGPFTEGEVVLAIHKGQITEENRVQMQGTSEWFVVRSHTPFAEALDRVRGAKAAGAAAAKADELSPRGKTIAWCVGLSTFLFVVYEAVNVPTSTSAHAASAAGTASPPAYTADSPGSRPDTPERRIARVAIQNATDAWKAYDALPTSQQTKEALGLTFSRAVAAEEPMDIISGPALDKINRREYRRRVAPLFQAEARVSGDDVDVLVPSADRAKCLIWGGQWAKESDSLTTMGFRSIHCDNPLRDWPLK